MPTSVEIDLSKVQPRDYLRAGFFDSRGRLREGINGYYSLAMAYHLREEKVSLETLGDLVDRLNRMAEEHIEDLEKPLNPLDKHAKSDFEAILRDPAVAESRSLTSLFRTAKTLTGDWRGFSALLIHVQRILAQLALITAPMAAGSPDQDEEEV